MVLKRISNPKIEAIEYACGELANVYGEKYYVRCITKGKEIAKIYRNDHVFAEKFCEIVPRHLSIDDPQARKVLKDNYLERKEINDTLRKYTIRGISLGIGLTLTAFFRLPPSMAKVIDKITDLVI